MSLDPSKGSNFEQLALKGLNPTHSVTHLLQIALSKRNMKTWLGGSAPVPCRGHCYKTMLHTCHALHFPLNHTSGCLQLLKILEISWNLVGPPWKIAKCWWQSWDSSSLSKLVGWHSDERWSELIITCSVRDSSYIACCHIIINQAVVIVVVAVAILERTD